MSSGSYYEEEMSSGGHRRLTAFIFLVNSHSKKSLFLLTMGLAPMKLNLWGMAES